MPYLKQLPFSDMLHMCGTLKQKAFADDDRKFRLLKMIQTEMGDSIT